MDKLIKTEGKLMYFARKIGEHPIQVFECMQFLDTNERVWETPETGISPGGRCAMGNTEASARNLVIWGPFAQGSSNRQDTRI